jgi:hypothetical protein
MASYSMQVTRSDLSEINFAPLPSYQEIELGGQVVLQVDRFALTANNITYGVAGDMIGYWQFFPAEGEQGHIPVWGIGTVVRSEHPDFTPGDRYYGYYPMASYLLVKPQNVTARGFVDGAEHRNKLPIVYNQYSLVSEGNGFKAGFDDHQMIYKPLFTTSFVIADFLADNDFFGAKRVILSSASSKTSFGLAFELQKIPGIEVVGLTSKGNKGFVEGLGLYDSVVTYDDITSLAADSKVVFVDMAGNRESLSTLHHHFGDNMAYSCGVGITHWDSFGSTDTAILPGAAPKMFFAPDQIQKRIKEWGGEKYQATLSVAWDSFIAEVDGWVTINHSEGPAAVEQTYRRVLAGAPPNEAYVLSLGD